MRCLLLPGAVKARLRHIRKTQIVRNHSNKLAVRRLAAAGLDRVAEIGIQGVNVASVPSNLDRVTDRALNTGRGSLVVLRNRRIKHLRHRIYHEFQQALF